VLPQSAWVVFAALLGAIVGSFLNVVAYRIPRGMSVVKPRSRCPWCHGAIAAGDNLPVIGYLLLRGRCRRCGGPIGWRYPVVEAGMATLFALSVLRFGVRPLTLAAALLLSFLAALALIDADQLVIPDGITFPGMIAGFLFAAPRMFDHASFGFVGPLASLLGVLCGAGGLFLVAEAWLWIRDEEGLGLGDAKMLALIGAFLGWRGCIEAMVFACFSGTLVALVLLALRRAHRRTRLPFGVFLALGGAAALFVGPAILGTYFGIP